MERLSPTVVKRLDSRKSKIIVDNDENIKTLAGLIYKVVIKALETKAVYPKKTGGNYTKMQCETGRLRSIEDVYVTAKSYFPDITIKQVEDAMERLIQKDILDRSFCGTVQRNVHSAFKATTTVADIKKALGTLNYGNRQTKNDLAKLTGESSAKVK